MAPDAALSVTAMDAGEGASLPSRGAGPLRAQAMRLDSCARDVIPSGHPTTDALQLARACAEGFRLVAREERRIKSGAFWDVTFAVAGNRCVRVLAASDGPALTLSAGDERNPTLATGGFREALAVLPVSGPLCVREPIQLRVTVGAANAASAVAELWQSEPL